MAVVLVEFSGGATSSALDGHGTAQHTTAVTSASVSSGSNARNDDLVILGHNVTSTSAPTFTWPGGFTQVAADNAGVAGAMAYATPASAGVLTETVTWTGADRSNTLIACFKIAPVTTHKTLAVASTQTIGLVTLHLVPQFVTLAVVSAQSILLHTTYVRHRALAVLSAQAAALGLLRRHVRSLAVPSAQTVTLTAAHRWLRSLSVRAGGTAYLGKQIGKRLTVAGSGTAAFRHGAIRRVYLAVLGAATAGLAQAKGAVATAVAMALGVRPAVTLVFSINGGVAVGLQVGVYPESINTLVATLSDPQTGAPISSGAATVTFTITDNRSVIRAAQVASGGGGGQWSADIPAAAWPRGGWPYDIAVLVQDGAGVTQRRLAHFEGIPLPPSP